MGSSDGTAMKVAVRQTRAMREQIAEGDRTRCLVRLIEWTIRVAQHPHACQLGCVFLDRLVELEAPFIDQRQRTHTRDRLRECGYSKDRIALDGRFGNTVAPHNRRDVADRSVSPDQG